MAETITDGRVDYKYASGYFDPLAFYNESDKEIGRWSIQEKLFDQDAMSRYILQDRVKYGDGYSIQECMDAVRVPMTKTDQYYIVPISEENRLDLVSYRHYGTCYYWWIIAYASKIYNPLKVPARTKLVIPARSTIMRYKEMLRRHG